MSKHQPIEAKPTQYGNTLFRSRLEARWAVFLDFTENVINWQYEPKTFKLPNSWTYTPDFLVKLVPWGLKFSKLKVDQLYLEVKPATITDQYRKTIWRFCKYHKIIIMVVQGDFYNIERDGIASHLHHPKEPSTMPCTIDEIFADIGRGCYHANHFRFDLKE